MVWLSEQYPRPLLRPIPSWFKETHLRAGQPGHQDGQRRMTPPTHPPAPRGGDRAASGPRTCPPGHRRRLHRARHRDPAARGGRRGRRDPRARRPGRRHLARQHLPRRRLRHPVAAVLLLVRAEPRLVAGVFAQRRDLRPHRGPRRAASTCCRWSGSAPRSPAWSSIEEAGAGRSRTTHGATYLRPHRRGWPPAPLSDASLPDIRGIDDLPRAQDPQRPLGPRLRPRRQAGRGDRHRRQRGPDRPRAGQGRPAR